MGALTISQLRKSYGHTEVLKGIDIAIKAGEFLILVGPSGCGKSTLLSLIAGLEAPSSGHISMGERDITQLAPKDRDIAMVFQSYALYPNMTVAQNMAFGLEMRGVPRLERELAVQRVAKLLQIDHLLAAKPAQLSGGQRQRVAMGRALARVPKLFLFDEPLSNLDAKLRLEMRAEIKLMHQRNPTTTVYVTHDQIEAMTLGDRIAVMNQGTVQQFGTPEEIYARPATRFVAEFMGSPTMNMLSAERDREGQGWHAGGYALPLNDKQRAALPTRLERLHYGLRPEHIRLVPGGEGSLAGRLSMLEPTGPETFARVETTLGDLTLRIPGNTAGNPQGKVGDLVSLHWDAQDAHLFDSEQEHRLA